MKYRSLFFIAVVCLLTNACNSDLNIIGSSLQTGSDTIAVAADTFSISAQTIAVPSQTVSIPPAIYIHPDSFLLGKYYSKRYGTTKADFLAQVMYPEGFTYPAGSSPDSAKIVLYYQSWNGDAFSPMKINFYQMDKATFDFRGHYTTDIDVNDYCSFSKEYDLGYSVVSARDAAYTRADTLKVEHKLSDEFTKKFFPDLSTKDYYTESKFFNNFKGVYVTTDFGSSTLLDIYKMNLMYYYHYNYTTKKVNSNEDSVVTVNDKLTFQANKEVRQVNRILHPDQAETLKQLQDTADFVFVSSPANFFTKVQIPLKRIRNRLTSKVNGKTLLINSAYLRVDVDSVEIQKDTIYQPLISTLMLVKTSSYDKVFISGETPTDSTAIISSISAKKVSGGDYYRYYYSYDLAKMIARELRNAEKTSVIPDYIELYLVPVSVTYDTSGVVSEVRHSNLLKAVTLRSGSPSEYNNQTNPMKIKIIYSGL